MSDKVGALPLTVAIPTFGREQVLVDTVRQLLSQKPPVAEILVIDQTPVHEAETESALSRLHFDGRIRWERLEKPSQACALNHGLRVATQDFVLMLDDDIRVDADFAQAHMSAFVDESVWAVVGQVLQPGETPMQSLKHRSADGPLADLDFPFCSAHAAWISNGMSGNMTVRRERALSLGGFDENFLPPVSYRFDTEFCKRLRRAGGRIRFEPTARIHHLRANRGGTRSSGSHLGSASPIHGMGDYYFALRQGLGRKTIGYMLRRPFREVCTRHHLRHPWAIPLKLLGELRALVAAVRLYREGPKYIGAASHDQVQG